MKYTLVTRPDREPITLDQLKTFLRITHNEEDDLLQLLLLSARENLEQQLDKSFISQTLSTNITIDPRQDKQKNYRIIAGHIAIQIHHTPVQNIQQVQLIDRHNTITNVPINKVSMTQKDTSTLLVIPAVWHAQVRITFVAGYGDTPDDVPAPLRQAILVAAAHMYGNRSEILEKNPVLCSLIAPYKRKRL